MLDKFHDIADKLANLEGRLSDPSLVNNQVEYQKVVREHAQLSRLAELHDSYQKVVQEIADNRSIVQDDDEDEELRELARVELDDLQEQKDSIENDIRFFSCQKIQMMRRIPFSKYVPEPVGTRPLFLLVISQDVFSICRDDGVEG